MTRTFNNVYLPIVGIIKRSTDKAILLVISDPEALTPDDEEIENWIPRSQILQITPMKDVKGNSTVMMSEWIIGQKDLRRFVRKGHTVTDVAAHPPVPKTPPAKSFVDMDDDIPY